MVKRDHSRPPSGRVFIAIRMGKDQNSPNRQWLDEARPQYPGVEQLAMHSLKTFIEVTTRPAESQHGEDLEHGRRYLRYRARVSSQKHLRVRVQPSATHSQHIALESGELELLEVVSEIGLYR